MGIQNNLIFLYALSVLGMLISFSSTVGAQNTINSNEDNGPKFIAIQNAHSGSISEINSTYILQIDDLSDKIILFSDRPNRIVQAQSIDDFIGNWSSGSVSFQADPPNAALVILAGGKEDVFEIELLNSHYDRDENRLSYNFTFLNKTSSSSDLPSNLEQPVLIIDSFPTTVNSQVTDAVTQPNVKAIG
jgi:hypothetical protein